MMSKELLAAVKACKHFGQIIRRCNLTIHTDHKNLTHDDMQHVSLQEQCVKIFLDQEFAHTFVHIKGDNNTATNGLSRLPMADENASKITHGIFATINHLDWDLNTDFPLDMRQIMLAQMQDDELQKRMTSNKLNWVLVVTTVNFVWVTVELWEGIVKWYDSNLGHPGVNQTINMIGQTFCWKGLCPFVERHISMCDSCQHNKISNKKAYGKIPLTSALRDNQPWERIHLDCCGPWTIRYQDKNTDKILKYEIHLLSMVNACTRFATAKAFNKNLLCRYPP